MDMELRWLQDFLAVAQTRSFTRASDMRHASQAALSRRIQQLESWVGARLIDRAVYPSCLTPEGERFLPQAAEMLKLAGESRTQAIKGARPSSDFLRVALPLSLATTLFPAWWHRWFDGHEAPVCEAIPTNLHDAVTALMSDSADLLLCFHSHLLPLHLELEAFERCMLAHDTLRPYVAPALIRGESSPMTAVQQGRIGLLLYVDGTYLGKIVRRILESAQWPETSKPTMRSDMADVLCQLAIGGHGVAWLPGCIAAPAVARGELAPVEGARWSLELSYLAYRNVDNPNPALHRVWAAICAMGEEAGTSPGHGPPGHTAHHG